MKKIIICGYFGFDNFGDEWLLKVLLRLILQFGEKNKEIFVLYNTRKLRKDKNIYYIPRWNIKYIIDILRSANTLIFCGGIFQDQTSILSFFYYFMVFLLAKILKKKVVVLSTEFIVNKLPQKILKFLIRNIDLIYVRNVVEFERIKNFNVNAKFCPDICFFDIEEEKKIYNIKTIGLILKNDIINKNFIISICKKLLNEYKLVFIPFHLKEDYKFCLEISKYLHNCEVRVWDKVENYKNIFKDIGLIITSRLHGIVMSINLGLPFVCILFNEKLKNFVLNFRQQICLLEEFNSNSFNIEAQKISVSIEYKEQYKKEISEKFQFLASLNYI